MIAAGLGCRRGCACDDLAAALALALARAGRSRSEVSALCAPEGKAQERGLAQLARELDLPLVWLPREALEASAAGALTRSPHAMQHAGVPSVAETAALAGAGSRSARLLGPRVVFGGATCALAASEPRLLGPRVVHGALIDTQDRASTGCGREGEAHASPGHIEGAREACGEATAMDPGDPGDPAQVRQGGCR